MANAKRYTVSLRGKHIYTGPIRSAELVYEAVHLAFIEAGLNPADYALLLSFNFN